MLTRAAAVAAALFFAPAAHAQVFIVASCGTVPASQATLTAGKAGMFFIDTNGNLCTGATFTPSGTQAVNLTQILGAAIGATNPLYVAPATSVNPWPVSAASLPLPTGAATSANQSTEITSLATIATNTGAAIPPGAANIGFVGVYGATYNTIAASQTTQALTGGSGGATGDYLSHCVVIPTSTSPGVVTIIDNSTTVYAFPGGSSSLSNLVPFTIPVGAKSISGAWKITTGANLSAVCVGKFT
jgi:hypothetical protein